MKNIQYIPTVEKTVSLPVDNSLPIVALALLALWCEQSRPDSRLTTQQRETLPIIAF